MFETLRVSEIWVQSTTLDGYVPVFDIHLLIRHLNPHQCHKHSSAVRIIAGMCSKNLWLTGCREDDVPMTVSSLQIAAFYRYSPKLACCAS